METKYYVLMIGVLLLGGVIYAGAGGMGAVNADKDRNPSMQEEMENDTEGISLREDTVAEHAARMQAAVDYGVDISTVSIIDVHQQEWPDGCLGLRSVDEVCTMALVSGFEIIVSVHGEEHRYRTNAAGTIVKEDK